jgi:DsbC/DsbD-like thiol-disulfide interchange protein
MNPRRLTILSLLCAFLSPLGASDAGPAIGSPFPESNLKSILGPKGAVISVGPQSRDMEQNQETFRKLGLRIAALSSKVHSGWYVLDARGVIVAKYLDDATGGRYTAAAILVHKFAWTPPEPAVDVEGKQLSAKAGESNATVAPGERVTLMLDLDLNPGMHVYAPGVEGYIPIEWKMQDSPAASMHAAVFPHSEKLYLKAIGETVPAYRGHFRLTRDITIQRPPEGAGQLTVPGSLRYQACDDRVCYIPQELHLTWTFQYEAFDHQRTP